MIDPSEITWSEVGNTTRIGRGGLMIEYNSEKGWRTSPCRGSRLPPHRVVIPHDQTDEDFLAGSQMCGACSMTDEELMELHPVVRQFAGVNDKPPFYITRAIDNVGGASTATNSNV